MQEDSILAFLKGILYAAFCFLDIDMALFNILMIFMILDTISGLFKVLKLNKSDFSMKVLLWGLVSKFGLLIVPLVVALMLKAVGQEMGFGVELIIKILIVSEFISTMGNIYTIKTGKIVKDIDIFSMLFRFVRCRALKLISNWTGNDIYTAECGKLTPDKEQPKEGEEELQEDEVQE